MIKDKLLFFIILVLALASLSMVSAQEPANNITTTSDSDVVGCVSDLNTTHNSVNCDLNQFKNYVETNNSVDDISFTYNSNTSTLKTNDNNELSKENNSINTNITINLNNTMINDNVSFSSNVLMNKTMSLGENSNTISKGEEFERALNNGGNYIIINDFDLHTSLFFPVEKSNKNDVYIDGNGHKIYGVDDNHSNWIDKIFGVDDDDDGNWIDIDIDKNTGTTTFYNCIFERIRIDMKSDVYLHNCTLQNTHSGVDRYGNTIYLYGCLLTMDNCKIINATNRHGYHGALYLRHGWANINNTIFQSCHASCWGTSSGAAIYSSYTTLNLNNCKFDDCWCEENDIYAAGVVYIDHDDNHINNCTFNNCHTKHGGAIFINGRTYINNCKFFNCKAKGTIYDNRFKGAIDRKDSDHYLEVNNCIIDDGCYNTSGYLHPADHYSADHYSNVYVNPESSDNNTGLSWDSPFKTIEDAMSIVPDDNGKIYLADSTHKQYHPITIDKTVTIIGNGNKTIITNNI